MIDLSNNSGLYKYLDVSLINPHFEAGLELKMGLETLMFHIAKPMSKEQIKSELMKMDMQNEV